MDAGEQLLLAAVRADAWSYRSRARRNTQAVAVLTDSAPRHIPARRAEGQRP